MANLTRIKNNQITDATVNASAKLQNYSVTSNKLANSLVYGSDLTISGNLTVNGNTTTVNTEIVTIEDPVILLASNQTGVPALDIGFIGDRGSSSNIAFVWNEANTEFAAAYTSTGETNTTITITGYANIHTGNANVAGNLAIGGNVDLTGTVTSALNVTGNVTGGNLLTGGLISATGNITGGNISTAGNVTASNFIGNISGNIDAAGSNTEIQFNGPGDILAANANFTYDYATNLMTVNGGNIQTGNLLTGGIVSATGNVTGGNLVAIANVQAENIVNAAANTLIGMGNGSGIIAVTTSGNTTQFLPSGQINLGGVSQIKGGTFTGSYLTLGSSQTDLAQDRGGNVTVQVGTGGTISDTWTFTNSGNLLAPGAVSAAGNVTGGNVLTAGLVSATGNVTGGNLTTAGLISATGNATAGNVLTGGLISATGNITTSANINTNSIVGSNVVITSTGTLDLVPTGNITVNNTYINNLADPEQDQDAATKIYVDTVAQGLDIKASVNYATANTLTNLNGAYTYNNGTSGVGATITFTATTAFSPDGNAVSVGQRILVKNEVGAYSDDTTPSAAFNGIYVVTNAGGVTSAVLTRAADFDNGSPSGEIPGAFTFVEEGSIWADSGWVCTTNNPITVGTTSIVWTQFSGAGSYTANTSAGLSLTGTVFSAKVDENTTAFDVGGNIIVKAGANLTTPNIGNATGNSLILSGNGLIEATTVSATGNVIGGNVTTVGLITATGNITSGNVSTAGLITATGNVTGGNVTTAGLISATGNVTGANLTTAGLISATGNVTGGNINFGAGLVSGTGNIYADTIFANISGNIDAAGSNTEIQFNGPGDQLSANANFTYDYATNVLTVNGGNIATGNLSAAGNVTGNNVNTGNISLSGNVISNLNVTGNVAGGNVSTAGLISATGNVTGGNIIGVTAGQFGNIVISGDDITGTNGIVNINSAGADVNFAVNGDTVANVFYVDAGTGTASFGTSTQTVNAIVAFNATNSVLMPAGNVGQRPAVGVTGMLRFNSTSNALEVYDNSAWSTVGVPSFTVIADEQFSGDGSTVAFTLSSTQTTNSCIVSINGVVQVPGSAYSVAGTDPTCVLTFTEAPASGDLIDVREVTTTTTVTSISNSSGNAVVFTSATAAQVNVTGDLSVAGSILGGNINSTAVTNGTSNVSVLSSGGNVLVGIGGADILRFTGFGIENAQANGTGNIGNTTSYFDTVFAKATSAQYADLAEKYAADAAYAPGTVVSFGGDKEVTKSTKDADRAVAGVISTNPSYIMNSALEAEHVAVVAFTGRVPTSVTGQVAKGDLMVSNGDGTARAEEDPKAGAIIGKALEDFAGDTGVIEVVIGRF